MRGLHLGPDGNITSATLFRLSRNSPGGVLFPRLEWLHWDIDGTHNALSSFRLFLSPRLKNAAFYVHPNQPVIPWGQVAALAQILSFLPSSLEHLSLMCGEVEEGPLRGKLSSLLLRYGPSLKGLFADIPMSETAIHHVMQLPNLHRWIAIQGPPRTVPLSIFPSLEDLRLWNEAALPWLHLLASHGKGVVRKGSAPTKPHTNIRETLKCLSCFMNTVINSTFLSSVSKFQNLVALCVISVCPNPGDCIFRLTDDNVESLAAALPHLETLQLGRPCLLDSCNTTVASLLSISVHCPDLTSLGIHFKTRTLVGDMRRLLGECTRRGEPRCRLRELSVGNMPLGVGEKGIKTIAMGLKAIFPCLMDFPDSGGRWDEVKSKLED
jgi:hypothetical protein